MDTVDSTDGIPIRLTAERWQHIVENHDDLAGFYEDVLNAVEDPDYIVAGYGAAKIALKAGEGNRFLAVVYKETGSTDGFILTAYFSSKIRLHKETVLWQKKP